MLVCAICGKEIDLLGSESLFFQNETGAVQTDRVCTACADLLRDFGAAVRSGEAETISGAADALTLRAAASPALGKRLAGFTARYRSPEERGSFSAR